MKTPVRRWRMLNQTHFIAGHRQARGKKITGLVIRGHYCGFAPRQSKGACPRTSREKSIVGGRFFWNIRGIVFAIVWPPIGPTGAHRIKKRSRGVFFFQ